MASSPPRGEPVPPNGELPPQALVRAAGNSFGLYVHVPFCRVRCGYCDFNTYVPAELGLDEEPQAEGTSGGRLPPMHPAAYPALVRAELGLATEVLGQGHLPRCDTVFIGGGTPTLLGAGLLEVLAHIRDAVRLGADAEVTTEANPDTISPMYAQELAAAGVTRVSLGMQSAVPRVLATLDRTHDPSNVAAAVAAVHAAGMAVSLDLIYGTPGESLADWRASVSAALALEPDHISAYALVVEEGTALGGRVRRGEVAAPDDDDEADKYELVDRALLAAGYGWYELSNWTRTPVGVCRHNLGYWRGGCWWGAGPGAHSHVGGVRWWNVRHPKAYAERLLAGRSPGLEREVLTAEQEYDEMVLLRSRLAEGLPLSLLRPEGRSAVAQLIADGLIEAWPALRGGPAPVGAWDTSALDRPAGPDVDCSGRRVVLTLRGRLLADTVVRRLLG